MNPYIIKTERLGLRNWKESDLIPYIKMNQDLRVMEFFPSTSTEAYSRTYVKNFQEHFEEHGFCYFATDRLDTGEFIGFIGMMHQNYEADFNPSIDIGWRLMPSTWGNGFATEGAKACLEFAFQKLGIKEIISVAPSINTPSIHVMKKIGMEKVMHFDHPKLLDDKRLRDCVLYRIVGD